MDVATIRWAYDYDRWVNERLRAGAGGVPEAQTRERLGASFDSIHGTLAHILGAGIIWLSRWRGVSPSRLLGGDDFANLKEIEAAWAAHQRDLDAFVADLTPERLGATLRFTRTSGEAVALPLWQLMLHVVNHGTHHRSELAEMLTRVGLAPPPTDMSAYLAESTGQG